MGVIAKSGLMAYGLMALWPCMALAFPPVVTSIAAVAPQIYNGNSHAQLYMHMICMMDKSRLLTSDGNCSDSDSQTQLDDFIQNRR